MELKNKKWPEEVFFKMRAEVLSSWPTGAAPDLDFAVSVPFLKRVPKEKNFAWKLLEFQKEGRTAVQPRAGVAILDEHIALLRHLEAAGADFLPTTIDSYTRHNRYPEAENGIKESQKLGRSLLNGFPAVCHGVPGCKRVYGAVNVPLQARHGTPDGRLLAEIIHASGWTSNEGGGISYNIPYAKNTSLEETIKYWQYVDRLVGFYEEQGIRINREPFGPLTGTLVPPSISNAVAIIEALLAAEQGVKSITVGYGQGGNINQDIAALHALRDQTAEYLERNGYGDVEVTTVFHQWMGGFPEDEAAALGLISYASVTAGLARATKMITKSPLESVGIPTKEANAVGIRASKFVVNLLHEQEFIKNEAYLEEYHQIRKEVDCLLGHVFILGRGDLAVGAVEAFRNGTIDIPFAPSIYNAGKLLPARDREANIRILEFGNIGFTEEIKLFHKEKIKERARAEGCGADFKLTIADVYAVSRGGLVGEPGRER
jgi:methylaspartate mutase epsilon subunit